MGRPILIGRHYVRMACTRLQAVAQLRRELNMAGLRMYTPQESGCLQNVYCEKQ